MQSHQINDIQNKGHSYSLLELAYTKIIAAKHMAKCETP